MLAILFSLIFFSLIISIIKESNCGKGLYSRLIKIAKFSFKSSIFLIETSIQKGKGEGKQATVTNFLFNEEEKRSQRSRIKEGIEPSNN